MKIIETPKVAMPAKPIAPGTPKVPGTPKSTDKPAAPAQPSKPVAEGKLRVEIVNTSGTADAGEGKQPSSASKVSEIANISAASGTNKNTVVISYTTNSAVVSKLTSLPFRYALQVTKKDSKADVITVIIGKDFTEK